MTAGADRRGSSRWEREDTDLWTAIVGLDGLSYTATIETIISPTINPSSTDSFLALRLEDVAALAEVNLLLVLALSLLASLVL